MTNLTIIHGGARPPYEGGDHGAGGKTPAPPPIQEVNVNSRYFRIIKRETKKGINFKVKFANRQHPFGFEEMDGAIQCEDESHAAIVLKAILKNALGQAGFKERQEPRRS